MRGTDPQLDEAIALYPQLEAFLRQAIEERVDIVNSRNALAALLSQSLRMA